MAKEKKPSKTKETKAPKSPKASKTSKAPKAPKPPRLTDEQRAAIEERLSKIEEHLANNRELFEQLIEEKPVEKAVEKKVKEIKEKASKERELPVDSEGRQILKAKRSKFKCATTGKHSCDECGKEIDRGETIRFVDVKYADGTEERYKFCCGKHRNAYCDTHGIPQLP